MDTPEDILQLSTGTPLITPNIDENSPVLCWPKGAPNPVVRKRKQPERPIQSRKRVFARTSGDPLSVIGNLWGGVEKQAPFSSSNRRESLNLNRRDSSAFTSGRRDSTTLRSRSRVKVHPPPPLINPYLIENSSERKKQREHLQKHYEFHRFKVCSTPGRFNLNFKTLSSINEGSFGKVFHVRCRNTGVQYAVKRVEKKFRNTSDIHEAFHEVFALSVLDKCPYINRFYSAWVEEKLYIQLEFCHGGCVGQLFLKNVNEKDYPFTDGVCARIIRHVTIALKYMHGKNIAHLDIKPQNILIRGDKRDLLSADFVLGDFGNARSLDSPPDSREHGDGSYLAPELLNGTCEVDLVKVDIFGLGASIYEVMHRTKSRLEWAHVRNGLVKNCKEYDPALMTLVKKMLNQHPVGRPGTAKILKEPIICSTTSENEETKMLREKLHEYQLLTAKLKRENERLRSKYGRKN